MNARLVALGCLLTLVGFGVVASTTSAPSAGVLLSDVQLPPNSCSISCPAGTEWRGQPASGGGVSCAVGFTPMCQCQDDARPIAGCESLAQKP